MDTQQGSDAINREGAWSDTLTFTVTATSTADNSKAYTVTFTVSAAALSGTLEFDDKTVTARAGGTHSGAVTFTDLIAGSDYELSISPQVTGMTIDNAGEVTIPDTIVEERTPFKAAVAVVAYKKAELLSPAPPLHRRICAKGKAEV